MELLGEKTIPAPVPTTWAALNDPDVLKACIAGCESVERTGDDTFVAVVAVKVGPVSARFKGNLQMTNVQAPNSYTINFDGQGGVAGHGKGSADVTLTAIDGEQTALKYAARAQVGGKLAQIGSRLVDAAAAKIAEDFFKAFEAHLLAAHAPPTAAGMAAAVPDAMAAGLAADATAAGMAADASAAGLTPGTVVGLATGASPAAAIAPQAIDAAADEPAPPPLAAPPVAGAASAGDAVAPLAGAASSGSATASLAGQAASAAPSTGRVAAAAPPAVASVGGAAAPAVASSAVPAEPAAAGSKTLWWVAGVALVLLVVYLLSRR